MNRGVVGLLLLSASHVCRADDTDERPDNKTLPKCDKVEILRLEGSVLIDANGQLRYKRERPPSDIESYYVQYGGYWTRLYGTKTLRGDGAERIAAYWRALAPEPPSPDGGVYGIAKCHAPGFAFRFYSGEKLLAESTVCWKCHNLDIHIGEKSAKRSFDKKAQPAKDLLAEGQNLFPDVKTEFDK